MNLFYLEELEDKTWNYEFPTLITQENKLGILPKDSKFVIDKFRIFRGIDLNNILITGDSLYTGIFGKIKRFNILIFMCGIPAEKAESRMIELISDIELTHGWKVIRTCQATSILFDRVVNIQISHYVYNTPKEVLDSFDMGTNCVGIWNDKVIFNQMGKFTYEYRMNIFDISRYHSNYENKIFKYLKLGFGIILPNMEIKSIVNCDRLILSKIYNMFVININGNAITITFNETNEIEELGISMIGIFNQHTSNVCWFNLYKLVKWDPDKDYLVELIFLDYWKTKDELLRKFFSKKIKYPCEKKTDNHNTTTIWKCYESLDIYRQGEYYFSNVKDFLPDHNPFSFLEHLKKSIHPNIIIENIKYHYSMKVQDRLELYHKRGGFRVFWKMITDNFRFYEQFGKFEITEEEFYGCHYKRNGKSDAQIFNQSV